jgi:hypothetical protein
MLQLSHFGMRAATAKSARRFHVVIPHAFQMSVHNGVAKLMQHGRTIVLGGSPFGIRHGLFDHFLLGQVSAHGPKVTLGKFSNDMLLAQHGQKVLKKVVNENLGRGGIAQMHPVGIRGGKKRGGLFLCGR